MVLTLLTIAPELQIRIFSDLDAVSLTRCSSTCKSVYETIRGSSLLMYIIQLYLDGLRDSGTSASSGLSYADRLKQLLRRRQAWGSTKPRLYATFASLPRCTAYDIIGGVFAGTDGKKLQIVSMPTNSKEQRTIIERTLSGRPVYDLTLDPTQDLIVILEGDNSPASLSKPRRLRIHIRSISAFDHHPLASVSPLELIVCPDGVHGNTPANAYLFIADNLLTLFLDTESSTGDSRHRVIMWDWNTSDLLLVREIYAYKSIHMIYVNEKDSSLSPDPVLASMSSNNMGVIDSTSFFVTSPVNSGSIRLYKFLRPFGGESPLSATHLATLKLPPVNPPSAVFRIVNDSGPIEANVPAHKSFLTNNEDRIHVFRLGYQHPQRMFPLPMNMFVTQRIFAKYISLGLGRSPGRPPLNIPWKEWGPANARLILPMCIISPPYSKSQYIHGQRVAFSATGAHWEKNRTITNSVAILDFSIAAVASARRTLPSALSPARRPGKLLPQSTIKASQISLFKGDIESYLPCVCSIWDFSGKFTAFQAIHTDGVITVDAVHPSIDENGAVNLGAYVV
ncbi:hypothetical protein BDN70DRAFT_929644 [Pholiota conissans]|uniref:F-box domain-containing protein n=1 Tax=Pholiota conissans TaxID=109636 RepID=A0A9P5ZA20_9AGAR|nr:hypothetical protein BDN70DRAFT_929644 [Pholiota conissans]